jgi:hypothetical protein
LLALVAAASMTSSVNSPSLYTVRHNPRISVVVVTHIARIPRNVVFPPRAEPSGVNIFLAWTRCFDSNRDSIEVPNLRQVRDGYGRGPILCERPTTLEAEHRGERATRGSKGQARGNGGAIGNLWVAAGLQKMEGHSRRIA